MFGWFSAQEFTEVLKCCDTNYPVPDKNSVRQKSNFDLYVLCLISLARCVETGVSREEKVPFWFFYRGPASTALGLFPTKLKTWDCCHRVPKREGKFWIPTCITSNTTLYPCASVSWYCLLNHIPYACTSVTFRNIREYRGQKSREPKVWFPALS